VPTDEISVGGYHPVGWQDRTAGVAHVQGLRYRAAHDTDTVVTSSSAEVDESLASRSVSPWKDRRAGWVHVRLGWHTAYDDNVVVTTSEAAAEDNREWRVQARPIRGWRGPYLFHPAYDTDTVVTTSGTALDESLAGYQFVGWQDRVVGRAQTMYNLASGALDETSAVIPSPDPSIWVVAYHVPKPPIRSITQTLFGYDQAQTFEAPAETNPHSNIAGVWHPGQFDPRAGMIQYLSPTMPSTSGAGKGAFRKLINVVDGREIVDVDLG